VTTTQTRKVQIGSISSGTLQTEDLIEAFAWELDYLTKAEQTRDIVNLLSEADHVDVDIDPDQADYILEELQDALSDMAPPLTYFGTLEGDGADFGFWPDNDAIAEARRQSAYHLAHLNRRYRSIEWLIDDGVWLGVNDHGNVTVYADNNGVPGAELWSSV
jgi:hypothetical protein